MQVKQRGHGYKGFVVENVEVLSSIGSMNGDLLLRTLLGT